MFINVYQVLISFSAKVHAWHCPRMSKDNHQLHLLIEDVGPILYTGDVTRQRKKNPQTKPQECHKM